MKTHKNNPHLIAKPLLVWFDKNGRKNLPWQATHSNPLGVGMQGVDPYLVWLSEIMLQQTQVATVIGYFKRFIQVFPTLESLANAEQEKVLTLWAGLGYYARARNLHTAAKIIVDKYQARFPTEFEQVLSLPGIGRSTAGAILSISFGQNHPILDGNAKRVIARYHQVSGYYAQSSTLKQLWHLAKLHTPDTRNADYTQAIMDLGATLCTRSKPNCAKCPIALNCEANRHNTQSQYPTPKPKKTKPTKTVAMLIFINEKNQIYLQKRPDKGIWGGLWSFIECENRPDIIQQAVLDFDSQATIEENQHAFKHSFTHYHLNIHPILVRCPGLGSGFRTLSTLDIAIPKPISKIIAKMLV